MANNLCQTSQACCCNGFKVLVECIKSVPQGASLEIKFQVVDGEGKIVSLDSFEQIEVKLIDIRRFHIGTWKLLDEDTGLGTKYKLLVDVEDFDGENYTNKGVFYLKLDEKETEEIISGLLKAEVILIKNDTGFEDETKTYMITNLSTSVIKFTEHLNQNVLK
jgi:hypothetical protein